MKMRERDGEVLLQFDESLHRAGMVFTASSPAVAKLIWPFTAEASVSTTSTTTYLVGWN